MSRDDSSSIKLLVQLLAKTRMGAQCALMGSAAVATTGKG